MEMGEFEYTSCDDPDLGYDTCAVCGKLDDGVVSLRFSYNLIKVTHEMPLCGQCYRLARSLYQTQQNFGQAKIRQNGVVCLLGLDHEISSQPYYDPCAWCGHGTKKLILHQQIRVAVHTSCRSRAHETAQRRKDKRLRAAMVVRMWPLFRAGILPSDLVRVMCETFALVFEAGENMYWLAVECP